VSLTYKDLKNEEANLKQVIEHAQEELRAVQILIRCRELRQETAVTVLIRQNLKGMTVKNAVRTVSLEWREKKFIAIEVTEELGKRGFEDQPNLRTNVGNALKELYDDDFLGREDIGDKLRKYEYWVKEQSQ